ncbi:MAG: pyrroline-5-carboxylate reductase [Desulfococcaceae bacterium]
MKTKPKSETFNSVGFIGGGNMGEAMIGALARTGRFPPDQIFVSDASSERLDFLKKTYGVSTTLDNGDVFQNADVVVLAVKPQQMAPVLSGIADAPVARRKLIISIAAGFPISRMEEILYADRPAEEREKLPIVRVMPNTPSLVEAGMSGMSPNSHAAPADVSAAENILSAMGRVRVFQEAELDAVTGVSGSGPAYVFYLAEAMAEGGVAAGLEADAAAELALATIEGAARLMREREESPAELRRKVTSPGGTTQAALEHMEANQVRRHIADAIVAAARRAAELSRPE